MKIKVDRIIASLFSWYVATITKALYPKNYCEDDCRLNKPKGYYITHK